MQSQDDAIGVSRLSKSSGVWAPLLGQKHRLSVVFGSMDDPHALKSPRTPIAWLVSLGEMERLLEIEKTSTAARSHLTLTADDLAGGARAAIPKPSRGPCSKCMEKTTEVVLHGAIKEFRHADCTNPKEAVSERATLAGGVPMADLPPVVVDGPCYACKKPTALFEQRGKLRVWYHIACKEEEMAANPSL